MLLLLLFLTLTNQSLRELLSPFVFFHMSGDCGVTLFLLAFLGDDMCHRQRLEGFTINVSMLFSVANEHGKLSQDDAKLRRSWWSGKWGHWIGNHTCALHCVSTYVTDTRIELLLRIRCPNWVLDRCANGGGGGFQKWLPLAPILSVLLPLPPPPSIDFDPHQPATLWV